MRDLEERERAEDKKKVDRGHRMDYRRFLEAEIEGDRLTARTKWLDYVKGLKNEQCFYNVIGQEPSNPRDIFFDYQEDLLENNKKIKSAFKNIFKENIELFPLAISKEDFVQVLKKFDKFRQQVEKKPANSFEFYANYLHEKLIKRQNKVVKKLNEYFRKVRVREDTKLEDLEVELKRHKHKSYFESISQKDKQILLENFKKTSEDNEKVSKISKAKSPKKSSESRERKKRAKNSSQSRDRRKKTKKSSDKKDTKGKKYSDDDDLRSDETEQGEIKDVDLLRLKKRSKLR